MAVYVQIGKNPRMLINAKLADVRRDFIEQMPTWDRLVPIYFYPSAKSNEWIGILLPRKWKMDDYIGHSFYWMTHCEYWRIDEYHKSIVDYRTVGWERVTALIKKYKELGFEL